MQAQRQRGEFTHGLLGARGVAGELVLVARPGDLLLDVGLDEHGHIGDCLASRSGRKGGTGILSELEDVDSGRRAPRACEALFITIGARPRTDWLPPEVLRDRWGSVFTGSSPLDEDAPHPWDGRSIPGALETSVPGVFAVGDTRRGSLKRVAAAVGEGSVVVSAVHAHLTGR